VNAGSRKEAAASTAMAARSVAASTQPSVIRVSDVEL
jgi:hypothetical protein